MRLNNLQCQNGSNQQHQEAVQFDGTNYPYWKSKMTTYIKSINRRVWKVIETKIEIADPKNPIAAEEVLLQNNDITLSAIQDAIDEITFE